MTKEEQYKTWYEFYSLYDDTTAERKARLKVEELENGKSN